MDIVLIGAGRLATCLGKAVVEAGHRVVQVYSRTEASAAALASQLGAESVVDIEKVSDAAQLYIFSVTDTALCGLVARVCGRLRDVCCEQEMAEKLFLHTAGSMPLDVFCGHAPRYGVFYPMQTFSKEKAVDFRKIPCFIEGCDEDALQQINAFAASVSDSIYPLSTADRKYLHLAAVFACNFANHCYAVSAEILESHGIPFSVMLPLIDETAQKVHQLSPRKAQTGPAVRYDENVMNKHLALLEDDPLLKEIYERMSRGIHWMSQTL